MKMDILVARQFFADFYFGEHHLPSQIFPFGDGWCVKENNELATFDFDGLTRLFFMAHERCIRVSISPLTFKQLRLAIHQRDPENASMMLHHPDLKGAIDRREEYRGKYDDRFKIAPAQTCTVYTPKVNKRARPAQPDQAQQVMNELPTPFKEKMSDFMAVFNSHLNNAAERAKDLFIITHGQQMFDDHIQPFLNDGVMSMFDVPPTKSTQFYVSNVARFVNEGRDQPTVSKAKPEKCPTCGSFDILIFTDNNDICNKCSEIFPAVINTGRR